MDTILFTLEMPSSLEMNHLLYMAGRIVTMRVDTQPRTISPTSRQPIFTKFSLEHVDQ